MRRTQFFKLIFACCFLVTMTGFAQEKAEKIDKQIEEQVLKQRKQYVKCVGV